MDVPHGQWAQWQCADKMLKLVPSVYSRAWQKPRQIETTKQTIKMEKFKLFNEAPLNIFHTYDFKHFFLFLFFASRVLNNNDLIVCEYVCKLAVFVEY